MLLFAVPAEAEPSDNARYAASAFARLDEPAIEQIARNSGVYVIRLLRGSDNHFPGFSVRIDVLGDHAHLVVKRFRNKLNDADGFDLLGNREISASELFALDEALKRIHFWELAPEEDLVAMAHRTPQPPPQVIDGKTYAPNEPLMVICFDSAIIAVEVAHDGKTHGVYRNCDNDLNPILNQIIGFAEPLLRARQ